MCDLERSRLNRTLNLWYTRGSSRKTRQASPRPTEATASTWSAPVQGALDAPRQFVGGGLPNVNKPGECGLVIVLAIALSVLGLVRLVALVDGHALQMPGLYLMRIRGGVDGVRSLDPIWLGQIAVIGVRAQVVHAVLAHDPYKVGSWPGTFVVYILGDLLCMSFVSLGVSVRDTGMNRSGHVPPASRISSYTHGEGLRDAITGPRS